MKRLRQDRPYGRRSQPEGSREPAKVFAISTEGTSTEVRYFEGFNQHSNHLNIQGRVLVDVLERQDPEDTKSAPQYILSLLDEYVDESGIDSDELWIVFDRDRQNNSKEQVLETINQCQQRGYNVAFTNPCFELWLLMHVSDLSDYDHAILLDNPKDSVRAKKRFIDKEISRLIGGYRKKNLQFDRFMPFLEQAVAHAELHCSNPIELADQLGTSVGRLVGEILATRH
ncbi:MAG: RloB family protein [Bacteroidota bacterium]|nr:RloB family protein [Bacteroidota bacterium]